MKSVLITSSILIALAAALRPILRGRIDPRMQYALWLIVALRLLVPVNLAQSAYSALALLDQAEAPRHIVETIGQASLPAQSYDSAHAQVIEEYHRRGINTADLTPRDLMDIETQARELMRGPTLAELAAKCAKPVWLGGAALMAAWFLLVNLRLRRKLDRAERIGAEQACGLPVFVSGALPSPCLCGVLRPAIYVTPAAAADPDRLRHVLAHETTHYRHRDHWWALVRCLCLCLYWFDPLVWWAAAMSRQDCELACDAGAIRRLGEAERLPYGRTLVVMISAGRCSLLQTATTMTGGRRRVRERVTLIARRPKTVIALALAAVLLVGCAVGCTFTGAPEAPAALGLSSDTLQTRLADVPEDLQSTVVNRPEEADSPNILASYWMNRDWMDLDGSGLGFLLSVQQMSYTEFMDASNHNAGGWEGFARNGDTYYAIVYATDVRFYSPDDAEPFHNAFDAIRAYAMETVLETEGVEPYSGQPTQSPDTLQERLLNAPEELRSKVDNKADLFNDTAVLADYWLNDPKWDLWSGWLLTLYRMDETRIQNELDNGLWPAVDIFARSGDEYYAILWASDGRYPDGDALSDEYWTAVNAMKDHVKATVLATQGVEPFDPYTTPPHFFSNVKRFPMEPGNYAIDGMDYTLVTSYEQIPEDPEQWYLVGYCPDVPVWMFTRGPWQEETMFQIDGHLTQVFPYKAGLLGNEHVPGGQAPQLMPLEGFGWGPKGVSGPLAVITHVFQGGTDQMYQLTVYDLSAGSATPYVHDMEPLMEDFNTRYTFEVHPDRRAVSLAYGGQTAEITFQEGDGLWDSILEYGFTAAVSDACYRYSFHSDGTFHLIMPIDGAMVYSACWILRFTGSGFETVDFQFVETSF